MGYLKKTFYRVFFGGAGVSPALLLWGSGRPRPLYFFGGAGVSPALLLGGESGDGLVGGGVEDNWFAVNELYGYDIAY